MTVVTLRAAGSAGPAQAWERYAVPARWSEWAPQIFRVQASAERLAPGVTGRVYGPFGLSVDFAVDAVDEAARRWAWTVRSGPLTLHLRHAVRSRGRRPGSVASLAVDGPLPIVLAYAPLARFALGRLVAAQPRRGPASR